MTHEEQVEAWERDNELLRNLDVPELTFEQWVEYGELADQEATEERAKAALAGPFQDFDPAAALARLDELEAEEAEGGANRSTYNNAMKETDG